MELFLLSLLLVMMYQRNPMVEYFTQSMVGKIIGLSLLYIITVQCGFTCGVIFALILLFNYANADKTFSLLEGFNSSPEGMLSKMEAQLNKLRKTKNDLEDSILKNPHMRTIAASKE